MSSIKEFQHLKIPLQDLIAATNNFGDTNFIARGGFGKVYRGELVRSDGLTMVAVKRLDSALGQGAPEFWKEVMLLSRYKHENLVSLLGFCDEGGENILVYEYLANKSLDLYLSGHDLSWIQRLRICIGAAHGLQFLHHPAEGSQERVLHCDIKSANILLDQNWKPKISDFGLSKFGPANQQYSYLFSNAVGTMGYCDPLYIETGFLTKESDIYSFGVVLFEVLCGRHCVQNYEDIRRFLARFARKCYEEKKLDAIIHTSLIEEISPHCLERFSTIAYQCLQTDRSERPSIATIVKELEIALQYQVEYDFEKEKKLKQHVVIDFDSDKYWETKLPRDLEVIVKMFKIPHAIYAVKKELFAYLQKGLLYDEGNKFFWINDYGKKCVLLSARIFLNCDLTTWIFQRDLRYILYVIVCSFPPRRALSSQEKRMFIY
uniref:receptor-like protein kinase HERK 1 n=1 Tax=Erigeron canadensis TaxID=72917 RepID=UPI001CB93C3C|nr:receptor-like protein kinase HERK 1 [Erigeron canadensis]